MNKLQEWGFNKDWWRNQRGEFWVIGQTILSIGFVLLPVVQIAVIPLPVRFIASMGFGSLALLLGAGGLLNLGDNLTPLPHPKTEGSLVTSGIYGCVRHPIYSSVIFLSLAYAFWQMSLTHMAGVLVLLLFFDRKAVKEEEWLSQKFPDYENYKRSVKKIIPLIY